MITTNQFKSGVVIRWNNELYQVLEFQHVKMQQRAPIMKTKMKNLKTGNTLEQSFRAGDKFESVHLERRSIQYLYHDGSVYHFMDIESFNGVAVDKTLLGDQALFLKEQDEVTGLYCDAKLVSIELPASVVLEVTQTDPGLRGDTAKGGTKLATLLTGAVVKVPLFINTGDRIKVDTRTTEYIERV